MRLSTLASEGFAPAAEYARKLGFETDLSKPDGKRASISMGLGGPIKGEVVEGVGPKGYVMLKTAESPDRTEFTFVPREAFAYPPKAGAAIEVNVRDDGQAIWKPDRTPARAVEMGGR